MFKKTFFSLIIIFCSQYALSDEKENIKNKLLNIHSIEFNFEQNTSNKLETGKCLLLFPKKLKCVYSDSKQKELIINKNMMAITQKRYNKTYFYPISKSLFVKILSKNELIQLINNSNLSIYKDILKLTSLDAHNQSIDLIFNKKNYDLMGWETKDKFNNKVTFLIDIISTNKAFDDRQFIIPKMN